MNFQNTLGMITEIKVSDINYSKRRITLEALTMLEDKYQRVETSSKTLIK